MIKNLIEAILHVEYFKWGSLLASLDFLVSDHLDNLILERIIQAVLLLAAEAGHIFQKPASILGQE